MKIEHIPEEIYGKEVFECDHFSYVGVLMNSGILRKVGLIHKEYLFGEMMLSIVGDYRKRG